MLTRSDPTISARQELANNSSISYHCKMLLSRRATSFSIAGNDTFPRLQSRSVWKPVNPAFQKIETTVQFQAIGVLTLYSMFYIETHGVPCIFSRNIICQETPFRHWLVTFPINACLHCRRVEDVF